MVLNSLHPLEIARVYKKGKLVAEDSKCLLPRTTTAEETRLISMNLEELREEDLRIQVQGSKLRAIRVAADTLITGEEIVAVKDMDDEVVSDPDLAESGGSGTAPRKRWERVRLCPGVRPATGSTCFHGGS